METIDGKPLRILMAVVEAGSIRRAAENLNVAPSVISRHISDIEYNIGMPIFERTSRGVITTNAGDLVIEHGRQMLNDNAILAEKLLHLKGIGQTSISICSGEGFLGDLLGNGLKAFRHHMQDISFHITTGGTDRVIEAVSNREVDIGIAYNPITDSKIRSFAIAQQPLCLISLPQHPLAGKKGLRLYECLESPYALLEKSHGIGQMLGRVAADQSIVLQPLIETTSIDLLRQFVHDDVGVTFLPRFCISGDKRMDQLVATELCDTLLYKASAHLLLKTHKRLPRSIETLVNVLGTHMVAFKTSIYHSITEDNI